MNSILAVFGMGGGELVVVMVAILILFGAKRIPEFAKGLGQGIKEFKKASNEVSNELQSAIDESNKPSPPKAAVTMPPTSGDPLSQTTAPTAPGAPAATVPKS